MSIAIEIDLHPFGSKLAARTIAHIKIWSEPNNRFHGYSLSWEGEKHTRSINGKVRKKVSAHQNIFHVLGWVLEDAKPKLKKLGVDYIPRYTVEKE